ncbi:MAG TPA: flagellar biosynthesis protein FliQ [Caulobacteraceae bacterium]|nr:flagellar biosynthesis protein FliQ [Caulobacteraceae bacterium]
MVFKGAVLMSGAEVLDVGRDAIWLTLQLCAPILIVGLVVGVGIGLMQALTQIQEATLIYAPKILAIFVALLIFLPLMGALMGGFMREIAARIATM